MSTPEFGGCATCEGRCCRRYLVPVTCSDVHAIARALGLAPERFAALVPDAGSEEAGIRLTADGPGFSIVLERRESACVFLMELPDGGGRCGVYANRPLLCRTFPAALREGRVILLEDIPCAPGSWGTARMDDPSWRTALLRHEREQRLHRDVVAAWNASVEAGDQGPSPAPADFFRFAMERCDRLVAPVR